MQKFTLVCLLAVAACVSARPEEKETYTDKYDNVDLDELLQNQRLLKAYVNCLLEKGKCSADGKELKEHIREALENNCGKCTAAQRAGTRKVIGHLINHETDMWNDLTAKYDPERKFVAQYETELKKVTKA